MINNRVFNGLEDISAENLDEFHVQCPDCMSFDSLDFNHGMLISRRFVVEKGRLIDVSKYYQVGDKIYHYCGCECKVLL